MKIRLYFVYSLIIGGIIPFSYVHSSQQLPNEKTVLEQRFQEKVREMAMSYRRPVTGELMSMAALHVWRNAPHIKAIPEHLISWPGAFLGILGVIEFYVYYVRRHFVQHKAIPQRYAIAQHIKQKLKWYRDKKINKLFMESYIPFSLRESFILELIGKISGDEDNITISIFVKDTCKYLQYGRSDDTFSILGFLPPGGRWECPSFEVLRAQYGHDKNLIKLEVIDQERYDLYLKYTDLDENQWTTLFQ